MTNELLVDENINIEDMIYEVRGKQVILDFDLAYLYKVETRVLNQAIKRNIKRFPEDFMFQLTDQEWKSITSHFVMTSKTKRPYKSLPYAFTEQGVAMTSNILHNDKAIKMSVKIIDAFVKMRKFIKSNLIENEYVNTILLRHDSEIKQLQETFNRLEEKELKNKIFFNGEIFDSYLEIIKILNQSKKEIIIIDNYADETLLEIISKINKNITLITSKQLLKNIDINKYNEQYNNLTVIKNNTFHDRFIILDKSKIYHLGSSINHLGNKTFAINLIEEKIVKKALLKEISDIINMKVEV